MKSNSFVCSICRSEETTNIFLPCLNIICNQCIASQMLHQLAGPSNQHDMSLNGSYVIVKDLEIKTNFAADGERSLYSFAKDDESYETIKMEGMTNEGLIKIHGSCEGYEVPYNQVFYENPSKSSLKSNVSQESLCNKDGGYYEEVTSKNNKVNKINSDDEIFEEVHVKGNAKQKNPPRPSFRKKSATIPVPELVQKNILIKEDKDYCTSPLPKCNEYQDQESLFKIDECVGELTKDPDDISVYFKCPFCQDLHWISECGKLFMPFPAPPRCPSFTSRDKVLEIIKVLKSLPRHCNSKVCFDPCRTKCCDVCGKVFCKNCLSLYHSTHHSSDFKQLNSRYAKLIKCYHDSNEELKQTCLNEMRKLETSRKNLNKTKMKTVELLTRQKELLISEVDKIFNDKLDTLEINIGIEISHLENSLRQINNHAIKTNQFIDFSKAYLSRDDNYSDGLEIFLSLISGHNSLTKFKFPEPRDDIKVCIQSKEVDRDALLWMIGDVYFKKTSCDIANDGSLLQENEVPKKEEVGVGKPSSKTSTKTCRTKPRGNRMSKIFRRSSLPLKSKTNSSDQLIDRSTDKDRHQAVAPSANFNLQLTSEEEDCKLVDFSVYDVHNIIAIDSNNRCFKILDLANDSLKVVPLHEDTTGPLKFVVVNKDEEFVFATAKYGSNHIKLHSDDGGYTIGESYLLKISSLACNSLKQIFASDVVHRKIFVHDSSGRLLFSFPRGLKHGKVKSLHKFFPQEMKINPSNDDVVVLDKSRGCSYLVFDRVGIYLFHLPGDVDSLCNNIVFNINDKDVATDNRSKKHNSKNNDIIFDEEGHIYQRSSLGDKLIIYDCNGKYLNEARVDIPNFGLSFLISVMNCPIRRSISEEESPMSKRSILLSTNPTTVGIYELDVQNEESKPRLCEELCDSAKDVDGDERMSSEIIESRYADMTGRMGRENPKERPSKYGSPFPPEQFYSTICDEDKPQIDDGDQLTKSDAHSGTTAEKSKCRLSTRFRKIFKKSSTLKTAY